jgi:hypothetical protein
MKKTLSAFLALSILTVGFAPKKAEAGFMVLAATQEFVWKHKYQTLDTVLVIALPVSLITFSCFMVMPLDNPLTYGSLISGIVLLGETVEQKKGDIAATLIARYPSLSDSPLAVAKFTDAIVAGYAGAKDSDGDANVRISAAQSLEIINSSNLDLTEAAKNELISTLAK